MRRLLSFALLTIMMTMFLAVFALPGFATEAEAPAEATEPADDEMVDGEEHEADLIADDSAHDSGDDGLWTGLIASLVAGIVVGGIGFFSAGTEGLDGHGEDH